MGAKDVLEPALVVSFLALGVWFNRSKTAVSHARASSSAPASPGEAASPPAGWPKFQEQQLLPDGSNSNSSSSSRSPIRVYRRVCGLNVPSRDTSKFRNNGASRLLRRFPFLVEVVLWALVYAIYQFGRGLVAVFVNSEQTVHLAQRHAVQLLDFETRTGLDWEHPIQAWFLARPALLEALTRVYSWVHIPATIAFFGWLYYVERHAIFARCRRTLALANLLAFIVFSLWPCMPPRLLPKEYGFVDAVFRSSVRSVWNKNKYQNQYAAMPSLHFGYSLVIGIAVFSYARCGKFNILAFLYPTLIFVTIVATANHYILDAVAGALVCGAAYAMNACLLNLLIVQDWVLYILHLHRPGVDGEDDEHRQHYGPAMLAYDRDMGPRSGSPHNV